MQPHPGRGGKKIMTRETAFSPRPKPTRTPTTRRHQTPGTGRLVQKLPAYAPTLWSKKRQIRSTTTSTSNPNNGNHPSRMTKTRGTIRKYIGVSPSERKGFFGEYNGKAKYLESQREMEEDSKERGYQLKL